MRKFKQIYIEITNICNLNCSFCPKNSRPKKFMTVKEFDTITDEIAPLTNTICLHLMGEPLLHPDISLFFDEAEKRGLRVVLVTNGTRLSENADMLLSKILPSASFPSLSRQQATTVPSHKIPK